MGRSIQYIFFILVVAGIFLSGCQKKGKIFKIVHAKDSGITFRNQLEINDSINGVNFEYVYNGAGLAVGDVNNDGLSDLFFAGNMVSSRLYLNLGSLTFKDITFDAGVSTNRWCTGTSFIDINDDGLLDLYICVAGLGPPEVRRNMFFINQGIDDEGIPHFLDMAEEMDLDDDGYSTMAVFFDYDKDQDLDIYILTNAMESELRNALRPRRISGEGPSTDRLYRNEGIGRFTNVSAEAGILQEGYGLGIGLCDINQDGWTDVYCSNDFLSNDLLWINNQDGTFSEESGTYFKHFTNNGMGMDMADYNNDGLVDVVVLDMLPMSNQRQKQMIGYRNLTRFYESIEMGYHPQFLRNTMQLNRGKFDDGKYRFSEIGYLSGIYQTDWSWSALLADYDNDGWKDLLITNGYRKDVTNLDYIFFTLQDNWMFGTPQSKTERAVAAMNELPDVKLSNFVFRNERNLTFTESSGEWGLDLPTFTNGTAYGDLDNDGDLDIVTNNLDQEVIIYENRIQNKKDRHYIKLKFHPAVKDFDKIGLKIWLYSNNNRQFYEYSPYRGYKSTVGPEILIGLGNTSAVDSMIIRWPDGYEYRWQDLTTDTTVLLLKEYRAKQENSPQISENLTSTPGLRFRDMTETYELKVKHGENSRIDLDHIPIILHNLGQYGPGIAVGDMNADGLEDIFVGNDSNSPGYLLMQQHDGTFFHNPFPLDSIYEDVGALLFDADQDEDLDLYVVSGGSNWNALDPRYQDRIYINDGSGQFKRSGHSLPPVLASGSCVTAADYDADGDLDLFVGSRFIPNQYPLTPKSFLLENQMGKFIDVSEKLGSTEGYIGMVSSALWTDLNGDKWPDLMIVGEYMPITILINENKTFKDHTQDYQLINTNGWWNSIHGADLDLDGDIDYIIGNYGLNSFFKPTLDRPVEIYASDYDKNGLFDPITTVYIQDKSYILHPRNLMIDQIPSFEHRFKTFDQYSTTPFKFSFTEEEISNSFHLQCYMLASVVLEKKEGNSFIIHELPLQAQFAPVYGIQSDDFNQDGLPDLFLIGNSYAEETVYGYYDASYGSVLINQGNFNWKSLENNQINLIADGDKRALAKIVINGEIHYMLSENNGYLQSLGISRSIDRIVDQEKLAMMIRLEQDDWYAMVDDRIGNTLRQEFYYGAGYLTQDSRIMIKEPWMKGIRIFKYSGKSREF